MTKIKPFTLIIIAAVSYLVLFTMVYHLLTKSSVYDRFFSSFMPTYENQNGAITSVKKAFTPIAEEPFTRTMDAFHYSYIKNNLYHFNPDDDATRFNFAFFPAFPLFWKTLGVSGIAISIFNFFLHIISLIILITIFRPGSKLLSTLAILSLPTLTVFLIPYSEGLFMLAISIALLGWKKENRLLYISGLLLASVTRPVFILLIMACIATEIYKRIYNRQKPDYKNLLITITTILSGTLLVTLFQWTFHHDSLLTFITAQKHWGTFLQFPKTIVDWSNEGYAMNVWALGFCFVFGSAVLLFPLKKTKIISTPTFDYWYYFSWIYLLLASMFVLAMQGGCLHSLYRYTLCTPFFYIIILKHLTDVYKTNILNSLIVFSMFIVGCSLFFTIADYGKSWDFSKTGFILLCANLGFFILSQRFSATAKYIGYSILVATGIIWNCYLLNMFLTKAWVFL